MMKRILVVGGGAAGFFAAIACAEHHPEVRVVLVESIRTPLAKVKISGGGRCNVTHHCFDPTVLCRNYPRGAKELRGPFSRFQPRNTVEWFESRGVPLKVESDGRMFPVSDSSSSIIHCLIESARKAEVEVRLQRPVVDIHRLSDSAGNAAFDVRFRDGISESFHNVILATGSSRKGYELARSLGHTIQPPVPSLFTFTIDDPRLADLAGLSFESAGLQLVIADGTTLHQTGPVLVTHWGLSGPAVLKLSAWAARPLYECRYTAELIVNWLPEYTFDSLHAALLQTRQEFAKRRISFNPFHEIPKRFWNRILEILEIPSDKTWANSTKQEIRQISQEFTQCRMSIVGKGEFKDEFVTCGGVTLREIDWKTMESRVCPGLYLAGEILDVDGLTGGFNFQNAWTTGWIAGIHAGRSEV